MGLNGAWINTFKGPPLWALFTGATVFTCEWAFMCLQVIHMCAVVSLEAKRGHRKPWSLMWLLGTKPMFRPWQALLTAKPPL